MRVLLLLTRMALLGTSATVAAQSLVAIPAEDPPQTLTAQAGTDGEPKTAPATGGAAALQGLAAEFLAWRLRQQPIGGGVPSRRTRPDGWVPDFSPEALERYRVQYRNFLLAAERLDLRGHDAAPQVDARLLRAAIQRVFWELEVLESPHRDPAFYVQQTLGSLFDLLLNPAPSDEAQARNLLLRLEHIPATLLAARSNLDRPLRSFAELAVSELEDVEQRMQLLRTALESAFPEDLREALAVAVSAATAALVDYRTWLGSRLAQMQTAFAIGPLSYQWYLVNVTLLPYSPGELLDIGSRARDRAVAWGTLQQAQGRDLSPLPTYPSMRHEVQDALLKAREIRAFLVARGLITVPEELPDFRLAPLPDPLQPLAMLGVPLQLPDQPGEGAVRYIRPDRPESTLLERSAARDPRPLVVYDGVPGLYLQAALSVSNPNPLRRHFIDATVNEGSACYMEELLLRAGLYEFSPKTKEIVSHFMQLSAALMEADVRLSVGDFNVEQAVNFLVRSGGIEPEAAYREVMAAARAPGRAIACEAGKAQILGFLADARLQFGGEFSLRDFHDMLLLHANVPIVLQRWLYLGRDEQVLLLDALGGKPATVPQ